MTHTQRQIVLGTLLGNGFICNAKKPYLCVQHSMNGYADYFYRKVAHLEEFGRQKAIYQYNNTIKWRSSCSSIWKGFQDLAYKDSSKNVTMKWLDELTPIGLAVFYCDCGCLVGYKKRKICLRTQSLDNNVLKQFFDEVLLDCSINKSKNSSVIVFSTLASQKFLNIVYEHIPQSLYNKLLSRQ